MSNWETKKLGEITSWFSGGTPKKDEPTYWNGDIPWISANSMDGTRYHTSDLKITAEGLKNGSRLAPQDALLLLVRGGALHTKIPIGIARKPLAFNQDVKAIVAKPEFLDPWFLLAWFMSKKDYLLNNVVEYTGIGAGKLDTVRLQNLEINLPPIKEQKSLAHIANCLEEKIILNQRMNNTLEGIAQALFKSWFVDFDPVKAKAEGRKPEGMDDATAALFPCSFTESNIGLIPEGWEVKGLDEIATFLNGLALQKYPALDLENYLPVIKISQLRSGDIAGADKASTDVPLDYIIRDGDILFSWSGSLEVEIWCGGRGALNQHLFKVSSKDFPKWFYFLWTRQHLDNFQKIAESKATTMGHIQRKHLSEAKVICPPTSVIQGVNEIMETMLEKYVLGKLENRNLAYLRDTLLPCLISGKLRVEEVSETVEALAL